MGWVRTKTFGTKMKVSVDGYEDADDLEAARRIVQQQYPYAQTILFSVPMPDIKELHLPWRKEE